ncbi:MAG TPA: hypothetical protein VJ957_05545, partial [Longimicrobiales bacterium]|nr:hypothetical protein [Longimicrobiales bacterium]
VDPRLHVTPGALDARLALQLRIRAALDTLDMTINRSIALRDSLGALKGRAGRRAQKRVAALNDAINGLVQMDVHSSEGTLLHETRLRSHLAYLAADIDMAYARPTQAQYAVFKELAQQAKDGESGLRSAMRR